LLALGIMDGLFCSAAIAVRRRWGARGLNLLIGAVGVLWLAMAWSQLIDLPTEASRVAAGAAFLGTIVIAFLVPGMVVHRLERREPQPRFRKTLGYAVGSSYLAVITCLLGVALVSALVRLVRAAVA